MSEKIVCRDCGADYQHTAGQCITNLRQEAEKLREVLRCAKNFSEAAEKEELTVNDDTGNAFVMLNVAIKEAETQP